MSVIKLSCAAVDNAQSVLHVSTDVKLTQYISSYHEKSLNCRTAWCEM